MRNLRVRPLEQEVVENRQTQATREFVLNMHNPVDNDFHAAIERVRRHDPSWEVDLIVLLGADEQTREWARWYLANVGNLTTH